MRLLRSDLPEGGLGLPATVAGLLPACETFNSLLRSGNRLLGAEPLGAAKTWAGRPCHVNPSSGGRAAAGWLGGFAGLGFADSAGAAYGLLLVAGALAGVVVGDLDGGLGVGGVEVGADLFSEAFGALVDSAAAHDLHLGAAIHFAEVVDQLADGWDGAGQGAVHDQEVGAVLTDEFEHFVVGHTAATEADLPAIGFEEVGAELAAEFFGFVVATEDRDFSSIGGCAGEFGCELVGQGG